MKKYGLPRSCLLKKSGEFSRVYSGGKRLHGKQFALIYRANQLPHNRLGISIPRKVGNAVRRNRIKRLVREVFRLNRTLFPPSCDVVVTIRPGFSLNTFSAMQQAITGLFAGSQRR